MSNSHRTSRKTISYVLAGMLLISMLFSLGGDLRPVEASRLMSYDPPIAVTDIYKYVMNTLLTVASPGVLSNDEDAENDPLTAEVATGPTANGGTYSLATDGAFTYDPPTDSTDDDWFEYRAYDGESYSQLVKVLLVTNLPPVAVNDNYYYTVPPVLAPGVLTNDTDPEGDTIYAVAASGNTHAGGTYVLGADGGFEYDPPSLDFEGLDWFYYKATDTYHESDAAKVNLSFIDFENTPPPDGAGIGTCMNADCANFDSWECTSNKTEIEDIYIYNVDDICTPPICNPVTGICTPDTGQYDFMVVFRPNAENLYNMGFWALIDNEPLVPIGSGLNNAIDGSTCYKSYLYPANPTGPYDFLGGYGPFKDLSPTPDGCGDASASDGLTYRIIEDVPIVCTDEMMEGYISTVVSWSNSSTLCNDPDGFGVCPQTKSFCNMEITPFDATNKPVDLLLTKETDAEDVLPLGVFDYTIRVYNNLYKDKCYRSSGYVLEDVLPEYLIPYGTNPITGATYYDVDPNDAIPPTQTGTLDTSAWMCVDADGNVETCTWGSIVQVKITDQGDLPTVPDPQPLYSEPVDNSYCTSQYHEFTLTVQLVDFDPEGLLPYVENEACVNGFQYDPIGVDYNYVDPVTLEAEARAFAPNNCAIAPLPLAVEMESFTATNGKLTIQLDWKTTSETHNLGFNLYRSTSETGERIKLNSEIITPYDGYAGSPMGATYHWTDTKLGSTGLRPNTTYYYWLEDVPNNDDAPEEFGPVTGMLIIGKK